MCPKHRKNITIIYSIVLKILLSFPLTQPQMSAQTIFATQRQTIGHKLQSRETSARDSLTQFRETEFYRTIIDNNLFRPLGWTPPRQRYPYRLLGTLIPKDRNIPKKAVLQATVGNTTHTVHIGEGLGEYTLTDIQPKQVILEKDGEVQTLKLNTSLLIIGLTQND